MSGLDHESSAAIDQAAQWLATRNAQERQLNAMIELRKRFGLGPMEAVQAMRESSLMQGRAH